MSSESKAPLWISVKDALPGDELDGMAVIVVVTTRRGRDISEVDTWMIGKGFDFWGDKVTRWMELPPPPKGEQA